MQSQNLRPFPRSLSYFVNKLSGYRRTCVRVLPSGIADAIKPSSIIRITLPENSLIDLDTFMIGGYLTIAANNSAPTDIDFSLVQNFQMDINGVTVCNVQNYNQLCKILCSWTMGADSVNRRAYLQFANGVVAGAASRYIALQNFPFGLSMKPSVIDTSLTGAITITLTLANRFIQAAATAADFTLDQVYASVDVISFSDDSYGRLLSDFVASGGILEIPFTNAFHFANSVNSLNQQTRFSLAAQSVDMLVGTAISNTYDSTSTATVSDNLTPYFTKSGSAVSAFGWEVNGLSLPSFMPIKDFTAAYNASALVQAQDTLGGHQLTTAAAINNHWAVFQKLNATSGVEERWSSGLDTRMTNSQFTFKTTGSSTNVIVMIWALTTSLLRVGAGRQLEYVQ